MKILKSLALLSLFIAVISCKAPEPLTAHHDTYISYGSMGGFAGSYTEYRLMPDGNVFKRDRHQGEFAAMEPMDKKHTKQFFKLMDDFAREKMTCSDPGNMTYFLTYHKKDGSALELSWGGDNIAVDPRIKTVARSLKKLSKEKIYVK